MKKLTLLLASATLLFASCKKDDNTLPNSNDNTTSSAPSTLDQIKFDDAEGVFVGIWTYTEMNTPMGIMDTKIGTAVAAVGDLTNGKYNDVGKVICKVGASTTAYELSKQSNNSYVYMPSATDPTGIPFTENSSGMPHWEVGSLGISQSSNYKFPSKPTISSSLDVDASKDYEFVSSNYDGADEIVYSISANNKHVQKTIKRTDAEYISGKVKFTSAELATLGSSNQALIQIAPYTVYKKVISGKNYYFINETVLTKNATIK